MNGGKCYAFSGNEVKPSFNNIGCRFPFLFRPRSRAPRNRILDKTIVNRWLMPGGNNSQKINHNGPQQSSNRKPKDCRSYLHQQQNGTSHQSAHTTAASNQFDRKQSSDYVNHATEANAQESADIDDVHVVKLDDSGDESDCDFEELKCNDQAKANIARFLLTFEEEDIHLEGLPTMELDKIFESGRGFRLFLSQVHSPFKFWFQLNDNLEMIDSLMDRLKYVCVWVLRCDANISCIYILLQSISISVIFIIKIKVNWHKRQFRTNSWKSE